MPKDSFDAGAVLGSVSHTDRTVPDLVAALALLGKVALEVLRGRAHAGERAFLEAPRAEVGVDRVHDGAPPLVAHVPLDTTVGHDLDRAVGEQDVDQHAVV